MQRYFIHLAFDGTNYHGWQIQPNGMTVQQRLQESLSMILRDTIEIVGAGRTDAGVHAHLMVAHFDFDGDAIDVEQLKYRMNKLLPTDIVIFKIEIVSEDLHARFSATKRTYRYFIHTAKDPFDCDYSYEMPYPLDFQLINEAATYLLEMDDFKAFCKSNSDAKTTLCDVSSAHWVQTAPGKYYFEISANRFLRNMVRAIVGTLVQIGRRKMTLEEFKVILQYGTRSDAGESIAAKGLFLWDICY